MLTSTVIRVFISVVFTSILLALPVAAIEYGGIGLKPANPSPKNPRTDSIFIYTLEPGVPQYDEVIVINTTSSDREVVLYSADSEKSSDGAFACEQLADEKNGTGGWIELEDAEFTLKANTNKRVKFTITPPSRCRRWRAEWMYTCPREITYR